MLNFVVSGVRTNLPWVNGVLILTLSRNQRINPQTRSAPKAVWSNKVYPSRISSQLRFNFCGMTDKRYSLLGKEP
jgi:hypothetical protein